MKRTTDMTVGSPAGLILKFALPLILTNIGQQLYMMVDGAIVGRGVGVHGLASVGATDWIYWMVMWSILTMTQGFSTFVSRYYGEKNYEKINRTIAMSAVLSIAIALILTVAGILSARPLLGLLRTPAEIADGAAVYLITMLSGTLIVAMYNLSGAILRAFGDGRTPLVAMVIAALLNVGLDLIFVFVFKWGIFGAAIASVIAQLVSFVYCFFRIIRIDFVRLRAKHFVPDPKLIKELLGLGLPLALQYVVIGLGGVILQSTINLFGSTFLAGYTAVNKLYGLLESSAIALGASFSTFFSQNYGAGNYERMRKGVKTGTVIAVVASLAVSAVTLLLNKYLLQLFLDVSQEGGYAALDIALKYLNVMACCLSVLYLIYVFRNVLQAMGNSVWSMISGFAEFAARVIMAKMIVPSVGESALFAVEPIAWLGALVFVMVPYFFYRKRLVENRKASLSA